MDRHKLFFPKNMFSDITPGLIGNINPLYRERERLLSVGQPFIDLISGNLNQAGILFPEKLFSDIMAGAVEKAKVYSPHPLGQPEARKAIQGFYMERGLEVSDHAILLTPGTSISYWYCFNLFANPGDEILCPKPSYPLFETIARLCGIRLTAYSLNLFDKPALSVPDLESQIGPKTRAIVVISPHNPTGIVLDHDSLEGISAVSKKYNLPVISDEVFSEFTFNFSPFPRMAFWEAPLVITLNGVSKMFSLPGLKIGWMALSGKKEAVRHALNALEMISDTFLPVGEIQQFAVSALMVHGRDFLKKTLPKIQKRKNLAMDTLGALPNLKVVEPDGGFYLTMKVQESGRPFDEDQWVFRLFQKEKVLIHPGYFYDMEPGHLVISYVSPLKKIRMGIKHMINHLG